MSPHVPCDVTLSRARTTHSPPEHPRATYHLLLNHFRTMLPQGMESAPPFPPRGLVCARGVPLGVWDVPAHSYLQEHRLPDCSSHQLCSSPSQGCQAQNSGWGISGYSPGGHWLCGPVAPMRAGGGKWVPGPKTLPAGASICNPSPCLGIPTQPTAPIPRAQRTPAS